MNPHPYFDIEDQLLLSRSLSNDAIVKTLHATQSITSVFLRCNSRRYCIEVAANRGRGLFDCDAVDEDLLQSLGEEVCFGLCCAQWRLQKLLRYHEETFQLTLVKLVNGMRSQQTRRTHSR